MNNIGDFVDKEENEQLRSIPAQRLIEKLSLLKNKVESAKKRWFWELLQNASDYNETVSVRLVVKKDSVEFIHNGAPFTVRDALNLISPDSNKCEDKIHSDNIGKFGTGLVSTHILSSTIQVKGICLAEEKLYRFSQKLDRSSFAEKGVLIDAITIAKERFKESLEETPSQTGFQTSFFYQLGNSLPTLSPIESKDIDLEYLYDLLPYTLCFIPKILSVNILDCRDGEHDYLITRGKATEHHISFEIEQDGNKQVIDFAYFRQNDVSTAFAFKENKILPFPKGISKIFCGLPLVGTEDIGLPFLLNSLQFEPTTEREGIELEPDSNELNRQLMKDSVELYKQVLDYIQSKKLQHAYVLANIRRKYNGTQASNTQFYNLYVSKYKQQILEHAIVINEMDEFINFSQIELPFKDSKVDLALYDNAKLVAAHALPAAADYQKWFESTDFTLFTEQKYTFDNLAERIEKTGNIYSFGKAIEESKPWLMDCLSYLKQCKKYIFAENRLLPNQNGDFCLSKDLFVDDELPKELKIIYNQLYESKEKKIEDDLLDKKFDFLDVVNQACSIENIARYIDDEIANQYSENQGNTAPILSPLNGLYAWMSQTSISKEKLSSWFHWYYPKRATLIVDMLTESQREQALVIAQSGKMEALATLATSDLTSEDYALLLANIKKLPAALSLLSDQVDDKAYADSFEGNFGEEIVYKDLLQKYPRNQNFTVIWASKERNEPCYDFEIMKDNEAFCYYDAKTTTRGMANSNSIPFFMRASQWTFLQTLSDATPYYIARVFKGDNGKIRYMRISEA